MAPYRLRESDRDVLQTVRRLVGPGRSRTSRAQRTIACEAGLSERTIRSAFKRLESWGKMSRTTRPIPTGGRKPDLIDLPRQRRSRRTPNRQTRSGSILCGIGTPSGGGTCATVSQPDGPRASQPRLFGSDPSQPKARKQRQPSQSDLDLALWLRIFHEMTGRVRVESGPTAQAEERRHLKVLRARVIDDKRVAAFLREYAGLDDKWLDDRDYPLRYALAQATYARVMRILQAQDEEDRRVDPIPDVTPEQLVAIEARARMRREKAEAERQARRAETLRVMAEIDARRRGN